MQTTRNYFFDILRILAVLLVVTSHYSYMFDTSTVLTFPREYLTGGIGRLGVSFFFMISGALAYQILCTGVLPETRLFDPASLQHRLFLNGDPVPHPERVFPLSRQSAG
ncbi:acyltransferase family protein [Citrobacter koseri]|uniref:acyltransferase family protein n=1 Tax=Citrobacter koseri TaxID=545 RepID=UPI002E325177|nr:acyltransferase family protein [Citrobacter koseri]